MLKTDKKIFLIILGSLIVVLLLIFFLFSLNKKNTKQNINDQKKGYKQLGTFDPALKENKIISSLLPDFTFNTFSAVPLPQKQLKVANTYFFKNNYSPKEAKEFATKLLNSDSIFTKYNSKNKNIVVYYTKNNDTLEFNLLTGYFKYKSQSGITVDSTGAIDLKEKINQFVRNNISNDSNLLALKTYKKKSRPGVTFVELNRDWDKSGLPIVAWLTYFNFNNNLSEKTNMKNLSLTNPTWKETIEKNPDIYATSDNTDGLKRRSQFNDMTFEYLDNSKKIIGINSTIRLLDKSKKIEITKIIDYKTAFEKLKNKEYEVFLPFPENKTNFDINKYFTNKQYSLKSANIIETFLFYPESSIDNAVEKYEPYYAFRGRTELENGEKIKFIALVSAKDNSMSFVSDFVKSVFAEDGTATGSSTIGTTTPLSVTAFVPNSLNTATLEDQNAYYTYLSNLTNGSLNITSLLKNDVSVASGTANINTSVAHMRKCLTATINNESSVTLKGINFPIDQDVYIVDCIPSANSFVCTTGNAASDSLLKLTQQGTSAFSINGSNPIKSQNGSISVTANVDMSNGVTHIFYGAILVDTTNPDGQAKSVQLSAINFFDQNLAECVGVRIIPPPPAVDSDGGGGDGAGGGSSPTLFISANSKFNIKFKKEVLYSYPKPVYDNEWLIDGNSINNIDESNFIYYEYPKVVFNKPQYGFTVVKKDLENFVKQELSLKLKLDKQEEERLIYELNFGSKIFLQNDKLFIGIIPQSEVDQKLPLEVNPAPKKTERYHFYISKYTGEKFNLYNIKPIARTDNMILEFGATN